MNTTAKNANTSALQDVEHLFGIDPNNESIHQLFAARDKLNQLIKERRDIVLRASFESFKSVAEQYDLSLEDALAIVTQPTSKQQARSKVAIKYRNPENNNETWTGRGKEPKWLAAKLASGQSLDNFLI